MNNTTGDVIRGKTHCDTVGDFFKNPYIVRFMRKWYREKYKEELQPGKKLPIWNTSSRSDFHDEYYTFVLNIFRDEYNFEEFLKFIREQIGADIDCSDLTDEYHTGEITTGIFALKEVLDQLSYANSAGIRVSIDSIKQVFATNILQVLESAFEHTSSEERVMNNFVSVEKVMEYGFTPVSTGGEILTFLQETEGGIMVAPLMGGQEFELLFSDLDTVDVSRREIILRIRSIKNIITYQKNERNKLNKAEEIFQKQLLEDYTNREEEGTFSGFLEFLESILGELSSQVSRLPSEKSEHKTKMIKNGLLHKDGSPKLSICSTKKSVSESHKRGFPTRVISSF